VSEPLVKVGNVSKKFCRSLKKSLWYGLTDLGNDLIRRRPPTNDPLRTDEFWAVQNVSFDLHRGECLGLIGRNGAGKTTLLKMLNGLIKPDQGKIELRGRIGALIALGAGFNPILSGMENIYVSATILGLSKREIDRQINSIVDFAELSDFIHAPVQTYSSGMQVRLGFAVASSLRPDILLLDEVLAVGDAAFRTKCFNRIHEILPHCAVIFVSHSMPQITRICSKLLLLDRGTCVQYSEDLGTVIRTYNDLTPQDERPTDAEGSGEAKILSVELGDANHAITEHLTSGMPFTITVMFWLSATALKNDPQLLLTIADAEDSNVAQLTESLTAAQEEGTHQLCLTFTELPFNSGRYSVTTNIFIGKHGRMAHVRRRLPQFTVQHSTVAYAPVILRATTSSHKPLLRGTAA
jgi:lipopolysaccharide transport system ATP-binding protein